jgi:hypothetical protein
MRRANEKGRHCLQVLEPQAYGEAGQKMPLQSPTRHCKGDGLAQTRGAAAMNRRAATKQRARIDVPP